MPSYPSSTRASSTCSVLREAAHAIESGTPEDLFRVALALAALLTKSDADLGFGASRSRPTSTAEGGPGGGSPPPMQRRAPAHRPPARDALTRAPTRAQHGVTPHGIPQGVQEPPKAWLQDLQASFQAIGEAEAESWYGSADGEAEDCEEQ